MTDATTDPTYTENAATYSRDGASADAPVEAANVGGATPAELDARSTPADPVKLPALKDGENVIFENATVRVTAVQVVGGPVRFDWYDKTGLAAGHSPDSDKPAVPASAAADDGERTVELPNPAPGDTASTLSGTVTNQS